MKIVQILNFFRYKKCSNLKKKISQKKHQKKQRNGKPDEDVPADGPQPIKLLQVLGYAVGCSRRPGR
jgi:hypothetical protein